MNAVSVERRDRPSDLAKSRSRPFSVVRSLQFFGWFVFVLLQTRGFSTSIYGYHGLRQVQTAISIREIVRGGPLLRYETPIFGPPWSIPLEFPLYQWICAAAVNLFGSSIDGTSRLVSALFGAGCVIELARVHRALGRPQSERDLLGAMAVLSPLLMFWSHTVLIETCSVFVTLLWLELALRWTIRSPESQTEKGRLLLVPGAAVIGFLAGATKATTVFPALVFVGAVGVVRFKDSVAKGQTPSAHFALFWQHLMRGLAVVTPPIAAAIWWSRLSEAQRLKNPRGVGDVRRQMFGTWEERLEFRRLGGATLRTLGHSVGSTWVVVVVAISAIAVSRLFREPKSVFVALTPPSLTSGNLAVASALSFVVTPFVLFHVHVVHDYYSVEILPYALFFTVFGLALIRERVPISYAFLPSVVAPVVIAFLSLTSYARFYGPKDANPMAYHPEMIAAVDRVFAKNDVIVLRGTVFDPSIGYHVDRKMVIQETAEVSALEEEFTRLAVAGYRSGFIQCGPVPRKVLQLINDSRRPKVGVWNGCTVFGLPEPTQ